MTESPLSYLTQDRSQQPKVGVSACLTGQQVRYDGEHKYHKLINELLAPWLNLMTFCPEVEAGLGIPRPPIQLVRKVEEIRALGVENSQLDATESLLRASETFAERASDLVGYIVKSRSPSCGSGSTPLTAESGEQLSTTDGLFVRALKKAQPGIIIVEENWLDCADRCHQFLARCYGKPEP